MPDLRDLLPLLRLAAPMILERGGGPVARRTEQIRSRVDCPRRWLPLWDLLAAFAPPGAVIVMDTSRGPAEQAAAVSAGLSRAVFGASAHSWGDLDGPLAVDCYYIIDGVLSAVPDLDLHAESLGAVSGRGWAKPDPPHVEIRSWQLFALGYLLDWADEYYSGRLDGGARL